MHREHCTAQDLSIISLVKGDERYVFLYTDDRRAELLQVFGRFASNEELSLTWHDAAVLAQQVRGEG